MEIEYIREFVKLAEIGNFQDTADALFITQSSLSKHIKVIEGELGVPLLDRTFRKATLNRHGELFLTYARQIAALQESYTETFYGEMLALHNTVHVGSLPAMAQYHITDAIAAFKREQSSFSISITEADPVELRELLRQKKCDMAFLMDWDLRQGEFEMIEFARDALCAVVRRGHPLGAMDAVPLTALRREDLLLLHPHSSVYELCLEACQNAGFAPRVAFTGHRAENIVDLVAKGMGVGLLTKKQAAFLQRPDIKILDISPAVPANVCLCYPKGASLSPAAKHFIRCAYTARES